MVGCALMLGDLLYYFRGCVYFIITLGLFMLGFVLGGWVGFDFGVLIGFGLDALVGVV